LILFIFVCRVGRWRRLGRCGSKRNVRLTFIDVETYRVVGVVYDYLSIRLGLRVLVENDYSFTWFVARQSTIEI
jgi:hypothetical protein